MEKLRRVVSEIAYAQDQARLSVLHRSLIPFLSFASSFYRVALALRLYLYHFGVFSKHRLPVPVISVGNLTWGGNGKTPMTEYIAHYLADSGMSPLILTRGYAGGDEAKMLQRHLLGGPTKIGVGANRAATAAWFFEKYGYTDPRGKTCFARTCFDQNVGSPFSSEKINVAILDDGMQHWSLWRDLEVVMVNGLVPWGNQNLLPVGPLREPLAALRRADVAIIHHADLVLEKNLREIELMIHEVKESIPIFYTRMAPKCFFEVRNIKLKVPLEAVRDAIILCVSAIGSADAFVQGMQKIGAFYVDRLDFTDHHLFQSKDIEMIRTRLSELEHKFGSRPIVVLTEKDYDRQPEILKHLDPFQGLALCSELQILPHNGSTEDSFKLLVVESLGIK